MNAPYLLSTFLCSWAHSGAGSSGTQPRPTLWRRLLLQRFARHFSVKGVSGTSCLHQSFILTCSTPYQYVHHKIFVEFSLQTQSPPPALSWYPLIWTNEHVVARDEVAGSIPFIIATYLPQSTIHVPVGRNNDGNDDGDDDPPVPSTAISTTRCSSWSTTRDSRHCRRLGGGDLCRGSSNWHSGHG